jgi:mannose-6-phosphate isomerase class I
VIAALAAIFARKFAGHPLTVAFDGWYGVDWQAITAALQQAAAGKIKIEFKAATALFKPTAEIEAYKLQFTETDDPGFGVCNTEGHINDLMDAAKVATLAAELAQRRGAQAAQPEVIIVYGPGAATPELDDCYDLRFYFDKTRQPILWEMWDGKLAPFGMELPKKNYFWKEYYYCDYYLLDRQKHYLIDHIDFWMEGIYFKDLKLVPRAAYDAILQTLVRQPVKEVPIFQPGPWGAYRYLDLFDVPGLGCNAWNELAGPELSILVDYGGPELINMPMTNLMQYNDLFLGQYLNETYPHLFPLDVWLDDGYFAEPTPAERISMPIHNHPSTDYVRQHFKEPLGRYETYYIAEAYTGANTWLGYKDDADLEEWERLCRESQNQAEIPNWKDYVNNVETNVGDLILIPPGTTHGHGGNQMVLEMDTCPSIAATEYSFFLYDFARPSWDDNTKTMTGKKVKMHLDHGFDTEKWVRAAYAKDHLHIRQPQVIEWTKDYWIDRYPSDPRMPFEVERIHFEKNGIYHTEGKFLHIVTLTVGRKVSVRSRQHPERAAALRKWESALIPACLGEYEFTNAGEGQCTIVLFRFKQG